MFKNIHALKFTFLLLLNSKACIEFNYDLYGGDIGSETVNNYKECHSRCSDVPACKTWTYSSLDIKYSLGDCILRNDSGNALVPTRHCKTGFKNSNNIKCSIQGTENTSWK